MPRVAWADSHEEIPPDILEDTILVKSATKVVTTPQAVVFVDKSAEVARADQDDFEYDNQDKELDCGESVSQVNLRTKPRKRLRILPRLARLFGRKNDRREEEETRCQEEEPGPGEEVQRQESTRQEEEVMPRQEGKRVVMWANGDEMIPTDILEPILVKSAAAQSHVLTAGLPADDARLDASQETALRSAVSEVVRMQGDARHLDANQETALRSAASEVARMQGDAPHLDASQETALRLAASKVIGAPPSLLQRAAQILATGEHQPNPLLREPVLTKAAR